MTTFIVLAHRTWFPGFAFKLMTRFRGSGLHPTPGGDTTIWLDNRVEFVVAFFWLTADFAYLFHRSNLEWKNDGLLPSGQGIALEPHRFALKMLAPGSAGVADVFRSQNADVTRAKSSSDSSTMGGDLKADTWV